MCEIRVLLTWYECATGMRRTTTKGDVRMRSEGGKWCRGMMNSVKYSCVVYNAVTNYGIRPKHGFVAVLVDCCTGMQILLGLTFM